MGKLLESIASREAEEIDRLVNQISADEWHGYLSTVTRSNTRSFYAHLARMEGRRRWGFTPADTLPLTDGSEIILGQRRKCEHIAKTFHDKLSAPLDPRTPGPERGNIDPNNCHFLPSGKD